MKPLHRHIRVVLLALSMWCGVETHAQAPYAPFEFQLGVQLPIGSLYRDQFTYLRRSPGASIALLLYSVPELPIGIRLRADFALYSVKIIEDQNTHSEDRRELSLGVDAAPRIIRVSVRDVEARFYAGIALRAIVGFGYNVTVLEGAPRGFGDTSAGRYNGEGFGMVGRAGWFLRQASKASPLRLDFGYQIGKVNGVIQHDLVFRLGFGN